MLKRISVHQLTVGMYLKEFCGSWMEHPFWRSSFVITDPKDIEVVRASSIREVWIDCSKGLDLPAGQPLVSEAESEAQVDAELASAANAEREVARTTLAAVFGQLSQRITDLRVVTEPDVEPNIFARAVRSFRLGYSVR